MVTKERFLTLTGLKVMVEVTPNHTSKRHRWFVESRRGGAQNKYKNYYVWDSGQQLENGTLVKPNNWVRVIQAITIDLLYLKHQFIIVIWIKLLYC